MFGSITDLIYSFRRYASRPVFNSYCQPGYVPFCPTGRLPYNMPKFGPDDNIEVYALKAPVFEFKFGDLLGKFVSMLGILFSLEKYRIINTVFILISTQCAQLFKLA